MGSGLRFPDIPVLIEMFALRASGFTLMSLANRYSRDVQAIRFHLVKHHIPTFNETWHLEGARGSYSSRPKLTEQTKAQLYEEPINQGKFYQEYLAVERESHRKLKKFV